MNFYREILLLFKNQILLYLCSTYLGKTASSIEQPVFNITHRQFYPIYNVALLLYNWMFCRIVCRAFIDLWIFVSCFQSDGWSGIHPFTCSRAHSFYHSEATAAWWECEMAQSTWNTVWQFLTKLNIFLW